MGSGPRSIHRATAPVRMVVLGLETWPGPVGDLVPGEAGKLQLLACGVQLVPLEVGLDLGHAALGTPAPQQGAFLKRQTVSRDVIRFEGDPTPQRLQPR